MNFAQMLGEMSNQLTRTQVKKKRKKANTPEAIAKQKATARANRNKLWGEAFAKHNNLATSVALADTMGRTLGSVNNQLIRMRNETPPPVKIVGVEPSGGSNPRFVYRWLL